MKALVISDIHGAGSSLRALMTLAERSIRPDALICCGDGLADVLPYRQMFRSFWTVQGNCDLSVPPGIPAERTERAEGLWVYITHGHALRVKGGLLSLCFRAREVEAAVACFGHTHRPLAEWEGGILLLNPGALCDDRYAILSVEKNGELRADLRSLA